MLCRVWLRPRARIGKRGVRMRRWVAEALGTYILVFAGTGAIVIGQETGGAVTHVGVALVFGWVVLAMIHAFGDISGAHLNPAVTLGLAAAGRFPWRDVVGYGVSQAVGGILASLTLRGLFPKNVGLGGTLPAGPASQSFVLELILTFILMVVILTVTQGAREKGITVGLAIGSVIALEAMFAGPVCGASMNPVRSLAPALVSGRMEHLWIYLTAPVVGALLAVPVCRFLVPRGSDSSTS